MERFKEIERSLITSYRSVIYSKFVQAVKEYELIKDGDRIAVCISGGKDSMVMAKCMQELKRHGKDNFSVKYLVMNPGYNAANLDRIKANAEILNVPIEIFQSDIFDVAYRSEGSPCYLCARMRRGCLYAKAQEFGCNKIALGHHFDDVIETILMGIFYNGRFQSMPPKLKSTNFKGMELIRPLYKVREKDIVNFARKNGLEFIRCACRFTENNVNSSDGVGDSKRWEMKKLVETLTESNKNAALSIFKSAYNANLDTLIGYKKDGVYHNFLEDYDDEK